MIPGWTHHVTQRGNRREAIFFQDGDHEVYLDLLAEQSVTVGFAVWEYCAMPNHVHRRFTNFIYARGRWTAN